MTRTASLPELLADARELLGSDAPAPDDPRIVLPQITAAVIAAHDDGRPADPALLRLGVRAQDLLHELHRSASQHRQGLLAQVQESLGRLGAVGSSADLLDRLCDEAVRSCGLRRVVLSRVEGDTWFPWMARFRDDPAGEERFLATIRGMTVDMADAPVERSVLEDRRPQIVHDTGRSSRYRPLVDESGSTSYVVAPITPAGHVVGFLHADHHPDPRPVDEVDRDTLWAFAEGFGRIYERTELHERLEAQRRRVEHTFDVARRITSAIDDTEIELVRDAQERLAAGPPPMADVDDLLTPREREVLDLIVRGMNNAAIAERLVIKPGTVKSHVKQILRKLGAMNRAELIARSVRRT